MNAEQVIAQRMLDDHEIYCIQPWCARGGNTRRAFLEIGDFHDMESLS